MLGACRQWRRSPNLQPFDAFSLSMRSWSDRHPKTSHPSTVLTTVSSLSIIYYELRIQSHSTLYALPLLEEINGNWNWIPEKTKTSQSIFNLKEDDGETATQITDSIGNYGEAYQGTELRSLFSTHVRFGIEIRLCGIELDSNWIVLHQVESWAMELFRENLKGIKVFFVIWTCSIKILNWHKWRIFKFWN